MASIALGIAGAGIGSIWGNPMLGFSIGMTLGGLLFPPKNGTQIGRLDDLMVTGSSYGATLPIVFGQTRVGGNIIWSTQLFEHHHSQPTGKGGSGPQVYTYTASFAVAVCQGPIYGFRRIWAEDLLIYDVAASPKSKYGITIYLGDETQMPDSNIEAIEGAGNVPAYRNTAYVVVTDLDLTNWGNRIPSLNFEIMQDPGISLTVDSVLTWVANECGLSSGQYDFSDATDIILGISFASRDAGSSLIQQMLQANYTDLTEMDGKIVAVRRGGAAVATLTLDDIGGRDYSRDESDPPSSVSIQRAPDLELPRIMEVSYLDPILNLQMASARAVRYTRPEIQGIDNLQTSLTMTDANGRSVAEALLYQRWSERDVATTKAAVQWLRLVPASIINLPVNGIISRYRVTKCDMDPFTGNSMTLVADDTLDSHAGRATLLQPSPGGTNIGVVPTSSAIVPTIFDVYSGMEFVDSDGSKPGFYVAATGVQGWQGGSIYFSPDGGTTWVFGGAITERSDFGTTIGILANGTSTTLWDNVASVDALIDVTGSLSAASMVDVDHFVNAALIGVEMVGFAGAAQSADQQWTLSTFKRGRRGTSMTGHSSGERFWHVTKSLVRVPVSSTLIGIVVPVKVLSAGQALTDVVAINVTIAANNPPYVDTTTMGAAISTAIAGIDIGINLKIGGTLETAAARGTLNAIAGGGISLVATDHAGTSTIDLLISSLSGTIPSVAVNFAMSPYTLPTGDAIVLVDTTGGAVTIQLTGGVPSTGYSVWVKNTSSGIHNVTVTTTSGSILNIVTVPPTGSVLYNSDGTNYNALANSIGN